MITSSAVAAWQPHEAGYVWDEKDWNTASGDLVEEKGGAVAGSAAIYFASKVRLGFLIVLIVQFC